MIFENDYILEENDLKVFDVSFSGNVLTLDGNKKLYFDKNRSNIRMGVYAFYSNTSIFLGYFKPQTWITFYVTNSRCVSAVIWTGIPVFWLFAQPRLMFLRSSYQNVRKIARC